MAAELIGRGRHAALGGIGAAAVHGPQGVRQPAGDDPGAEWGGDKGRAQAALKALGGEARGPWAVLIGPEGGFAPEERERLRALEKVTPVTLGPRILRADTAAISALTLWQAALGDWA